MTTAVENEREADEQTQRAELAVRELAAMGRMELEADAAEEQRKTKEESDRKAAARRAVVMQIKRAVVEDGSVPGPLFPFMRLTGLGDDGTCPNGYVTVIVGVAPPGMTEDASVWFNVVRTPEPSRWYVKGEWHARVDPARNGVFSTFSRAVAAALAAGPAIDF